MTVQPAIAFLLAILLFAGTTAPVHAGGSAGEYHVKAAFVYNFAKFIEWPESAFDTGDSPIRIGVLGEDPFDDVLDKAMEGKNVRGRGIEIVRSSKADELAGCHIVFLPVMKEKDFRKALSGMDLHGVLTLCDTYYPEQNKCIISFVLEESKIRFDINNVLAKESDIRISSKLLSLGRNVKD